MHDISQVLEGEEKMGRIEGTFIFPHPPIMVKEVGMGEAERVASSIDGAMKASERIAGIKPDTIVIITPHGTMLSDAMTITSDEKLTGSLSRFGASGVKLSFDNDLELVDKIMEQADKKGTYCIPMHEDVKKTYRLEPGLDHGTIVPLYFVNKKYNNFKLVHITYSLLPRDQHYKLGIAIRDAAAELDRKIVVIASGDLSHRLIEGAPAGFSPRGKEFDKKFIEFIEAGEVRKLLSMPAEFLESAGECAYNSAVVLMGCLDGCSVKGEILSYEGPFGVGYCIAELYAGAYGDKKIEKSSDPYVKLAVDTLETYIKTGKQIVVPSGLPDELLTGKAGVFVSLKKYGELRGCIGTIAPTTQNIAMEIIQNAVSAGTRDPRFSPVEEEELPDLVYSVDVLHEPEPIRSKEELDVKRYGVIVKSGFRSGLLLPNLEGVDTVDYQVDIALKKAGIKSNEHYRMERFEVVRHY